MNLPLLTGRLSRPGWKATVFAEGVSTLFLSVAALLKVALVKVATLLLLPMGAAGCICGAAV